MQIEPQTATMLPRVIKGLKEVADPKEESKLQPPGAATIMAALEGFDAVEYQVYDAGADLFFISNPSTYREELESMNSFVVTDPTFTELPVIVFIRTRGRLLTVASGLGGLAVVSIMMLPQPYIWVALLAMLGPLSVVGYGLKNKS